MNKNITIKIEKITSFPFDGFDIFKRESRLEGYRFLDRLELDWVNNKNRFNKQGEAYYVIKVANQIHGVGGINNSPSHEHGLRIGRLRRFYVLKQFRRQGLGQKLLLHIIGQHASNFEVIQLYTTNPEAASFYEKNGFQVVHGIEKVSHELKIMEKYDHIGIDYNATRKADPFLAQKLVEHLQPKKNGNYLDIGCGTGNYTVALNQKGYAFVGIDPSTTMLEQAKLQNSTVAWKLGAAEHTGLPSHSLEGIIAFLTIHHWTVLEKGFAELYRVLRPNSKLAVFTATPKQMQGYWLCHYFPKMMADSIAQMPSLQTVEKAMRNSGLSNLKTDAYFIHKELEDKFLYCGKHHPELYFDPKIQQGISSFSALANKEEVKHGLSQLREDSNSGKINEIIKSYENELGDYMFILSVKG